MNTFLLAIKKNIFFGMALLICFFLYYFYIFPPGVDRLCVNARCFFVEMATNKAQWEKGLAGRNFLSANRGMFFIFDQEGDYPFWMKNMKIPLDLIFIDKNLTVVSVVKNAQPCWGEYCPYIRTEEKEKILYVLEINAGAAEKAGISKGQKVSLFLDKQLEN